MSLCRLAAATAAGLLLTACETLPFHFPDDRAQVRSPDAWHARDADEEEIRQDVTACYRSAEGQIQRDRMIDDDIRGREGQGERTRATADVLRKMDAFGYDRRRDQLIDRCMRDKGYVRDGRS